jgi:nitrogen fixation/metabolism regulation signal transduction histidine kinase|tara:strand:+ start:1203 stop:1694 length:492 start_codon:yes stop_codon:yes gene_type:complete
MDYRPEPIIAAWRPLNLPADDLEWGLVAKIDQVEAFASQEKLKNQILTIGLIIALIVIGFSLILSRSISKPIKKLRDATIKLGKGNLKTKVEIKTGDELEELGNSFNETVRELDDSNKKLTESEESLNAFLSNSPIGVSILEGPEFKYLRINKKLADLNGLSI